jgi:hypothetical protein
MFLALHFLRREEISGNHHIGIAFTMPFVVRLGLFSLLEVGREGQCVNEVYKLKCSCLNVK